MFKSKYTFPCHFKFFCRGDYFQKHGYFRGDDGYFQDSYGKKGGYFQAAATTIERIWTPCNKSCDNKNCSGQLKLSLRDDFHCGLASTKNVHRSQGDSAQIAVNINSNRTIPETRFIAPNSDEMSNSNDY